MPFVGLIFSLFRIKSAPERECAKMKVKLSPSEQKLLDLLPNDGRKIDTQLLLKEYYKGQKDIPFHARGIIVGLVRSLTLKGLIKRGERRGPRPIEVWRKKRVA